MEALAYEYRPIFYLHSKEKYLPVDFTEYIKQSRLKHLSDGKVIGPNLLTPTIFGNLLLEHPEWNNPHYSLFLTNGIQSEIIWGQQPNLAEVPLYVKIRSVVENGRNFAYMTYAHLYAYNGPFSICCRAVDQHFADNEDITIKLELGEASQVVGYYNSRHNGGVWLSPKEVETSGKRPIFYSALNSHASYNTPGTQVRYWSFLNDFCERSILWDTNRLVFIPENMSNSNPEQNWLLFRGKLGDGNVDGFGAKGYISAPEITGEYGASCQPWAWC